MDSWTCVSVQRGPGMLDDKVMMALKKAACQLNLDKFSSARIREEICEGAIKTQWKTYSVGGRSGIMFHCELDAENGAYQVNFLLSTADLERGAERLRDIEEEGWQLSGTLVAGEFPVPELYQFRDLSSLRTVH